MIILLQKKIFSLIKIQKSISCWFPFIKLSISRVIPFPSLNTKFVPYISFFRARLPVLKSFFPLDAKLFPLSICLATITQQVFRCVFHANNHPYNSFSIYTCNSVCLWVIVHVSMIEPNNNNFHFEPFQNLKMFNNWTLQNVQMFKMFQVFKCFKAFVNVEYFWVLSIRVYMLNIDALHLQVLEHFQVFNILKCKIAAEWCRMDIGLWLERSFHISWNNND